MSSSLWIVEAAHAAAGPIATIRLPTRLRPQIHGWWVPTEELEAAVTTRGKVA
jgi:carotenoid cleavage dioxygenase